ncbi:hypothetical protein KL86SPO_31597 [uncultured Sporomusa sp.]|uniref:Uncharacterized protein n=1 Tax=uncultured Sporomusa sp. TaxID=307249 RepID=A0A212LV69_9FIRM|nr:hypothetical protein KL86SPO_31597 [uncultured Sporomusa sp.]
MPYLPPIKPKQAKHVCLHFPCGLARSYYKQKTSESSEALISLVTHVGIEPTTY